MMIQVFKISQFRSALSFAAILLATAISAHAGEYQVNRVIDGDTIEVMKGAVKLTVRLVGIDAPEVSHKKHEPGQPFSQQSTKYLAKIALNRSADVKSYGADRYGRVLGEVFMDGNNVNLEWLRQALLKFTEERRRRVKTLGHTGRRKRRPEKQGMGCGLREISM